MKFLAILLAGLAVTWSVATILERQQDKAIDRYVARCRLAGGWAVETRWPSHDHWLQCARLDAINLPGDKGATS